MSKMEKLILYAFMCTVLGAVGAVCLFVAGGFMWSTGLWGLMLICGGIGTAIGFLYGICEIIIEKDTKKSEEVYKQRVELVDELKPKAMDINDICSKNKTVDKPSVSTTYKADILMTEIMNELTRVAEKQGKVNSLAEELSKKGGASL